LPWSLEAADDYGLFLVTPQPTNEELAAIVEKVRRESLLQRSGANSRCRTLWKTPRRQASVRMAQ